MFILLKKYIMKNVSKLLLLGVLAWAGYFFGMVVYWACVSVPGIGVVCGNTDVCNNIAWCLCNGNTISQWETCTNTIAPSTDSILWTTTYWQICSDGDWCTCTTPSWNTTVSYWDQCTWDISLPVLSAWSISVVNRTATFTFNSTKAWTVSYQWSCGNWNLSTAVVWNNSTNFSNLSNNTYSSCQIRVTDNLNNASTWLSIPSFTVNVTWWVVIWWWGWGWSTTCSDLYLTCTNGVYTLKTGYYCVGWNLGKTCNVSVGTGVEQLLETIKEKNSVVYEYTPQWVKIRIFVPKYKQALIRKTILSLNRSLYTAINKKLLRVTDPSYMIENFENLTSDSKILVYREIGELTKLYNDFLGILYLVLDMKQKEYLPLARTYLQTYFKEFATFKK